jgi:hypothetical protein
MPEGGVSRSRSQEGVERTGSAKVFAPGAGRLNGEHVAGAKLARYCYVAFSARERAAGVERGPRQGEIGDAFLMENRERRRSSAGAASPMRARPWRAHAARMGLPS